MARIENAVAAEQMNDSLALGCRDRDAAIDVGYRADREQQFDLAGGWGLNPSGKSLLVVPNFNRKE